MNNKDKIISNCRVLLEVYREGKLGYTRMPEDSSPSFTGKEAEKRLCFFTLPMSLNYQRDSYKLWEAALKTFGDKECRDVFDIGKCADMKPTDLRDCLMKHKLALQPNKHISTWKTIAETVLANWGSMIKLLEDADYNYSQLKILLQDKYKKGFPYLSGPKIFNYWCFILNRYCKANLKNADLIEIAPDTHVIKCSVLLGVITEDEAKALSREKISERWREILAGSSINPIDMHPPLWFWSRNNFVFKLK